MRVRYAQASLVPQGYSEYLVGSLSVLHMPREHAGQIQPHSPLCAVKLVVYPEACELLVRNTQAAHILESMQVSSGRALPLLLCDSLCALPSHNNL